MQCRLLRSAILSFGFAAVLAATGAGVARAQQPADEPSEAERRLNTVLDRWNKMPPEERDRELAKLPQERARRIRQLLRRYNQMTPQEQKDLRKRYRTFSELSPEEKETVRQRLREFHALPQERRPVVHGEIDELRKLPEAQRQARMNSEEFRGRYSPQEQQIIKDLTEHLESGEK